ncbi:intermembrane phospholipid transport protein YdbH family protein [Sandaracinus amylolyticus]|uniref:intermembrane phospholipid transport protein YdbH family protein n=1 Tax=Sandaracinus amylolyticus TaxID=927083 RepID=UPI001F1F6CC3|nr:YdbH domain-containing protein [Sandaracinus amylolyticus]UJR85349.1 Hypothetical protein I5071_74290 [Sandaracinus amylolyticus]
MRKSLRSSTAEPPPRAIRRTGARIGGLSLALLVLGALVWRAVEVEVPALVASHVRSELAKVGLPDARFRVERVALDHVRFTEVRLAPDLEAESIEVGFDPFGDRGVSMTIEGARWSTALDEDALRESTPARLIARAEAPSDDGGGGPGIDHVRIERSHVVLARADGAPIDVAIEGELAPGDTRGAIVLETETFGAWAISMHPRAQTLEIEARAASGETLDLGITQHDDAIAWSLDGTLPRAIAAHLAPAIELSASPSVRARGTARGTTWTLDDAHLDVHVARAAHEAHEVRDAHVVLDATGEIAPGLALDVRSHLHLAHARIEDVRLERAVLAPRLDVERAVDGSIIAHTRTDVGVKLGVFAVGSEDSALSFHDVALALSPRGDRPMIARTTGGDVEITLHARARSPRADGVLRASGVRADGDVDLVLGANPSLAAPLAIRVARMTQTDAELSLRDVRLDLPFDLDAQQSIRARGRGRARHSAWSGVALGPTEGTLALVGDQLGLTLEGRASARAPFHVDVALGIETGRGHVDIEVPIAPIDANDALHRVFAKHCGARIVGRTGVSLHGLLGPQVGAGEGRVTFENVALENESGQLQASGLSGTLDLAHLDPPVSAGADRVRWDALTLGGTISLREGSANIHFARPPRGAGRTASGTVRREIVIAGAEAAVGGGRVQVAPFRVDPEAPSLALDLTLRGIELQRLASAVSSGRASGTGRLDGRMSLRVDLVADTPRIVLGRGRLSARGPGRVRIRELPASATPARGLDQLRDGEWIEQRVLAALADFEYSRLAFELHGEEGTTRLRARVQGRGARTPQELDLTLQVNGLQPALDRGLVLLGRGPSQEPS